MALLLIVDAIPQSISLILNSSFQTLSLPSLKQVYLVGMNQPESSFVDALKMIPPVTRYLILESKYRIKG